MQVAAVQHTIVWQDPSANHAHLAPLIAAAAQEGADLVVLSEMFSTGFSMDTECVAQAPDGPSTIFLQQQAALHGVWIAGSVPVADQANTLPVNRLVLAGPQGEQHHYDKEHPFSFAGEDQHYRPGQQPVTVSVHGVRCTLTVCYDLRFVESYWPLAAHTDCYLVVANWPQTRRHHWRTLLAARAIENQAYVVGVNRVGSDLNLEYSGDSVILSPLGEVLAECPPGMEATLMAEVDPGQVAEVRSQFPFMNDRRP